jgi:alpha-1,3-glucosyltransferase
MHECCSWLPLPHRLYLGGLVALELYCVLGHRALLGEWLPFVPLMLTSVYCALAFTWTWGSMAWWFAQQCFG